MSTTPRTVFMLSDRDFPRDDGPAIRQLLENATETRESLAILARLTTLRWGVEPDQSRDLATRFATAPLRNDILIDLMEWTLSQTAALSLASQAAEPLTIGTTSAWESPHILAAMLVLDRLVTNPKELGGFNSRATQAYGRLKQLTQVGAAILSESWKRLGPASARQLEVKMGEMAATGASDNDWLLLAAHPNASSNQVGRALSHVTDARTMETSSVLNRPGIFQHAPARLAIRERLIKHAALAPRLVEGALPEEYGDLVTFLAGRRAHAALAVVLRVGNIDQYAGVRATATDIASWCAAMPPDERTGMFALLSRLTVIEAPTVAGAPKEKSRFR